MWPPVWIKAFVSHPGSYSLSKKSWTIIYGKLLHKSVKTDNLQIWNNKNQIGNQTT